MKLESTAFKKLSNINAMKIFPKEPRCSMHMDG